MRKQADQQLVIDGLAWRPRDSAGAWAFNGVWDHASGAGFHCLRADVEVPVGADIGGATLHYRADAPATLNLVLQEFPSGPESAADPAQTNIIQYVAGVSATTGDSIGSQNLPINPNRSVARLGYSQTIEICTDADVAIGDVRLDFAIE